MDSDCPFGIFKLFLNIGSPGIKLLRPSELHFYKSKYRSTHLNDAAQQILQHCPGLPMFKKSLKIPKGQSESVYRRRTDNTMTKRKSTKGQTTIYKTYI
jgi:hypothetical protein